MPRAGSTKVKTGCFTCKVRKVKCDETRPTCHRCQLARRPCTGYPEVHGQAQFSWTHLLTAAAAAPPSRSPSSLLLNNHDDENAHRALSLFRSHVAPALSKHSSAPFWNVRVSQVAAVEPAVHHALAAISTLYEGLLLAEERRRPGTTAAPASQQLVLTHYNRALGHLHKTPPHQTDRNVVLLVCLLFICIEAMQGDATMAIAHCRHGVLICNAMPEEGGLRGWAREELQPMFLRLATFPYFFGMEAGEFPEPSGNLIVTAQGEDGWERSAWDSLVNRTVRVVRQGLRHRHGPLWDAPPPASLVQEQRDTLASLGAWREHYRARRRTATLAEEEKDLDAQLYREMEGIAGLIWVACCLGTSDSVYDAYMADFEELLGLSQQLVDRRSSSSAMASEPRLLFSFEMGFTPFLYFVVLRCRRLELRVRALRHILLLGYDRENLFDTRLMYGVGLRLVELEHGVGIDPTWPECAAADEGLLPKDEVRVRMADITEKKETRVGEDGRAEEYTKVRFLYGPEAIGPEHVEWVKAQPLSRHRLECLGLGSTHNLTEGDPDVVDNAS